MKLLHYSYYVYYPFYHSTILTAKPDRETSKEELLSASEVQAQEQEANTTLDKNTINDCLILKLESYPQEAFRGRTDFKYVIAPYLKEVSNGLFY